MKFAKWFLVAIVNKIIYFREFDWVVFCQFYSTYIQVDFVVLIIFACFNFQLSTSLNFWDTVFIACCGLEGPEMNNSKTCKIYSSMYLRKYRQ